MKIIQLTSVTNNQTIHMVVGPGLYFTKAPNNQATAVSATSGVVLVTETEQQIAEAINNKEKKKNGTKKRN